jgi:hypothetical protein
MNANPGVTGSFSLSTFALLFISMEHNISIDPDMNCGNYLRVFKNKLFGRLL